MVQGMNFARIEKAHRSQAVSLAPGCCAGKLILRKLEKERRKRCV